MALRIMTNESSINAQRNLEGTTQRLSSVFEKLSSGSRINHAADDAAGLAISDTLNATIRSLGQAIRNTQDGASMIQVIEGGTSEITNMLMRVRELAMQAASDTVGDRERKLINTEVQELKLEVDRVAQTTKYADKRLLNGESGVLEFQVGTQNDPEGDRISFDASEAVFTAIGLGIDGLDIQKKEGAQGSLEVLDEGIQRINELRAKIGSVQSRLNTTFATNSIYSENLSAARSRIRDTDIALESTNLARETIIRNSGVTVLMQANQTPAVALQLLKG